jgi:small-conductance mechanosensitive channel
MAIPSIEDMMAFGLTIAVILVYLITAVVLRVHPVTAGIGMVLLIFAVYLAGIANNVVQSVFLVNNTYINQTVTSAPGLVLVSNNIVTIVLCVGVMCILLAYLAFRNKGMNPNEF